MIQTNVILNYTNQQYLIDHNVLTDPCNLHQALAYILNEVGDSKHWQIVIKPTETEYFTGEKNDCN
jgi:hypothetical protein